ncbi:MAG: AAA family ATPase [Actinomycetota bacterium]|nr:AAA family ATPase [Actinomycetota bacterium]
MLEGRLIWLALSALRLGTSVVLDFGLWSREERHALRWLARSVGAASRIVYLPIDRTTQLARIADRQAATPEQTFPMTPADTSHCWQIFQPPGVTELQGHELPEPPVGAPSWQAWAAERWPSSTGI